MTDSGLDQELDRSERQFAVSEGRRAYRSCSTSVTKRRLVRLTRADASPEPGVLKTETTAEVPRHVPADPEAALRHARIGFVAVTVLVFLLVWIVQRRKGG